MSLDDSHFAHLDIPAEVERHTSTKLRPGSRSGKQWVGACPYEDCSVDDNGFMVWPELTTRGRHFYCRGCRRSGDIVKLLMDIKGYRFPQACELLEISLTGTTPSAASGARVKRVAAPTSDQAREREVLQALYHQARGYLAHKRARAYLAARGVPYELAVALGLAYLPPFSDIPSERVNDAIRSMRAWFDRLIFPLTSAAGPGFTGRALAYWQEGMNEDDHKELLKAHKVPRYKTTYPAGYFHADILETSEHATFIEGPFDALALLAGGIIDAVATCGTSLDALAIPLHLQGATLAYDGDTSGKKAAQDVRKLLRREVGILDPRICTPPNDGKGKDWSERYRLHGREGLAPLLASEQRGEGEPVSPGPAEPAREPIAGVSPWLIDPDPYTCEVWYLPGENNALHLAIAALTWSLKLQEDSELVELLAGASVSLFVEDPARALTWIAALKRAREESDQAQLLALAAQVDMPADDIAPLLPATEQDQGEASAHMSLEQFTAIAERLAGVIPGCSVRIMPAGTWTIQRAIEEDQARERELERATREQILARRRKRAG